MEVIAKATEIAEEYARQGYDLSVRQLYYQFVARKVFIGGKEFLNLPENYERLQDIIGKARDGGVFDWDFIDDRGRVTHEVMTSPNLKTFLQKLNESFKIDKWKGQARYVELMVEKQALEGVLLPVCQKWEVPFTANKGYSSKSSMYRRSKKIQSMRDVEGKEVHLIYLGDHDPSGIDMSRDIEDRMAMYSDGPVTVHRIALNHDQVMRLNPPENPVKPNDSRAKPYIEEFGHHCWELDAINPSTLASMVEHAIKGLLNLDSWKKAEAEQARSQERLQDIIDNLPAGITRGTP
jgi:hypothetical protein